MALEGCVARVGDDGVLDAREHIVGAVAARDAEGPRDRVTAAAVARSVKLIAGDDGEGGQGERDG